MSLALVTDAFEDQIQISLPPPVFDCDISTLPWVRYNPRKDIPRWGLSLTSLDGGIGGTPDLDSLVEYNSIHATQYNETHFKTPTQFAKFFPTIFEKFEIGRSHMIRLGPGGFFPFHRDVDPRVFRILYCIEGCQPRNLVWILDRQTLEFKNQEWYFVNTKKLHSLFSFQGCTFAIFNVLKTEKNERTLVSIFETK